MLFSSAVGGGELNDVERQEAERVDQRIENRFLDSYEGTSFKVISWSISADIAV